MMTYDNIVEQGLFTIPEFKNRYDALVEEDEIDETSGAHIIFGYAFVPVLLDAYKNKNDDLLKRMFLFVEEMAKSSDKEVVSVCDYSILEAINGEIPDDMLCSFMGEETMHDFDYMKKDIGYLA